MTDLSLREMLEAGVHFGHQTRYWNPKMAAYLYGHRNKIHIIDLEQTRAMFQDALNFVSKLSANKGTILFVGTKRAAQQIIREEAERCGMPYINLRWLGGLLTNYKTVKQSTNRLRELEQMKEDGSMERMSKKEALHYRRELEKLERNLLGIKDMEGWPDALFVIDVGYEDIAVSEAAKLKIPVVGIVDSNNNPDGVDYVIPGNDDAIRSIRLYAKAVADAIITGKDSIAHLGDGGDKDDFIETDAKGAPVVREKQEKESARKKIAHKKTRKPAVAEPETKADSPAEPEDAPKPEAKADSPAEPEDASEAEAKADSPAEPEEASKPEAKADSPAEPEDASEAEAKADSPAEPEDAPKPEAKADSPAEPEEASKPEAEADSPAEREEAPKPEAAGESDDDKARVAMTRKLLEVAGQRETITYGELRKWLEAETGIDIPPGKRQYDILDAISSSENQSGRGMLGVVVVRAKEKTPGGRFYTLAGELGRNVGSTDAEKEQFLEKELNEVYDACAHQ